MILLWISASLLSSLLFEALCWAAPGIMSTGGKYQRSFLYRWHFGFCKISKNFLLRKISKSAPLPHHGFEGVKKICNSSHFRIAYATFSSVASTPNTTVKLFFSLFVVCVVCSFTLYQSVFFVFHRKDCWI